MAEFVEALNLNRIDPIFDRCICNVMAFVESET